MFPAPASCPLYKLPFEVQLPGVCLCAVLMPLIPCYQIRQWVAIELGTRYTCAIVTEEPPDWCVCNNLVVFLSNS